MKSTDVFKQTIKAYLDKRAQEDPLFAVSYAKPGKSIDDCCTYILNQVRKSGRAGFDDSEIFGMAVHFWDEDNIEVGKPVNCNVVINRAIELTEEEKEQARIDAIKQYQADTLAKMVAKPAVKPKKKEEKPFVQPGLFD